MKYYLINLLLYVIILYLQRSKSCNDLDNRNSPRKRKLRQSNKNLRSKIRRLELKHKNLIASQRKEVSVSKSKFIQLCDTYLPQNISDFVKIQVKLADRKLRGARYTSSFKKFALTIYFLSPKCYRFLQKVFKLPSESTLHHFTTEWQYSPGLNDGLFKALKVKVDRLTIKERHISLCVDEMGVKPFLYYNLSTDEIVGLDLNNQNKTKVICCNEAMVLMACGIAKTFKQPLAYFFSKTAYNSNDLKGIIFDCIEKLTSIGFIVDAFISDMGSNFVALSKKLGITPEHSHFEVNGKKIYYLFDPPHLIKATRNNMYENKLKLDEQETDWKYIKQFYEADKQVKYRLAPKLTDKHLDPKAFKKMKVKCATQVLSRTVVVGMSTYMQFKKLPQDAAFTIKILKKFDKLFDIFNSSLYNTTKIYRKPLTADSVKQIAFLHKMFEFIGQLRVVHKYNQRDLTNHVQFLRGWRISIKSLLGLRNDFPSSEFKEIFTRRLNQDCLENFFGLVRQQGGSSFHPTAIQFSRAFKKLFCMKFLNHSSGGENCETDFDELLLNMKNISKSAELVIECDEEETKKCKAEPLIDELKSINIVANDYDDLDLINKNGFVYVSGYFGKKILKFHEKCDSCIYDIMDKEETQCGDVTRFYLMSREFNELGNGNGLIKPSQNWVSYLQQLEELFLSLFDTYMYERNVLMRILKELINVELFIKCKSFPKLMFLKMFIRIRIYYICKFVNQGIKSKEKNLKLLILTNEI